MEIPIKNGFYFYVLLCHDGSFYGGYTVNLINRVTTHNAGNGAKYTKPLSRRPVQLLYFEQFKNQHDALSAEYKFKHQSRQKKIEFLKLKNVSI